MLIILEEDPNDLITGYFKIRLVKRTWGNEPAFLHYFYFNNYVIKLIKLFLSNKGWLSFNRIQRILNKNNCETTSENLKKYLDTLDFMYFINVKTHHDRSKSLYKKLSYKLNEDSKALFLFKLAILSDSKKQNHILSRIRILTFNSKHIKHLGE